MKICERFRFINSHFDKIIISYSGGKDSECLLSLALKYLPHEKITVYTMHSDLRDIFTFNHIEKRHNELRIAGISTILDVSRDDYLGYIDWDENKPIHKKPLIGYDNGAIWTDFKKMCKETLRQHGLLDNRSCQILGLRGRESLNRYRATITERKGNFQGITWSTVGNPTYFYPIYDFTAPDVIVECGENLNPVYHIYYQFGFREARMRVGAFPIDGGVYSHLKNGDFWRQVAPEFYSKISKYFDFCEKKKFRRILPEDAKIIF